MIKVLGAILIIITTTWLGFRSANRLGNRTKQINLFSHALQMLETEIMYSQTPLLTVTRKLSSISPMPVAQFFQCFSETLQKQQSSVAEAWTDSLNKVKSQTDLKQQELEILNRFGETLGKHDRLIEQKQIRIALTHLQREEQNAREYQQRYEKMMKSFGVLIGMLFVILLL